MRLLVVLLVAFATTVTPSAAFWFCVEPPSLMPPSDCLPAVMKMVPACTGFLTNSSVTVPPSTCCDAFNAVGLDRAAICYCHVANGDIQKLLPAPMNYTRMLLISPKCGNGLRMDALAENCGTFDVPPMTVPPSPPPAA